MVCLSWQKLDYSVQQVFGFSCSLFFDFQPTARYRVCWGPVCMTDSSTRTVPPSPICRGSLCNLSHCLTKTNCCSFTATWELSGIPLVTYGDSSGGITDIKESFFPTMHRELQFHFWKKMRNSPLWSKCEAQNHFWWHTTCFLPSNAMNLVKCFVLTNNYNQLACAILYDSFIDSINGRNSASSQKYH